MKRQQNTGGNYNEPLGTKHESNDKNTTETLLDKHEKDGTDFKSKHIENSKIKNVKSDDDGLVSLMKSKDQKALSSQDGDNLTIKQIIKKLIRIIFPKNTGVSDTEDPNKKEKRSLKYKLRRQFLQDPDLDEGKYHDLDDTMVWDFVYVYPEIDLEKIRKERLIDFVANSVGRVLQISVCQPFDTVKVKLETFPHIYANMFRCIMLTYRLDGIWRGLYAGTLPAMVASLAENSILFVAYGSSQATIARALEIESTHELSVFGNACAGSLAAFFSTFALCPTELVKCKLQSVQEMKSYVPVEGKVSPVTPYQLTKQIFQREVDWNIPIYKEIKVAVHRITLQIYFFLTYRETVEFFVSHFLAERSSHKS